MNTGKEYRTLGWFLRCNLWSYGFWFGFVGILELYFYHAHGDPIYWETFHLLVGIPAIPGVLFGFLLWMGLAYPTPTPMEKFRKEQTRAFDAVKYAMNQLPTKELRVEFADNYKKYIDESLDKDKDSS